MPLRAPSRRGASSLPGLHAGGLLAGGFFAGICALALLAGPLRAEGEGWSLTDERPRPAASAEAAGARAPVPAPVYAMGVNGDLAGPPPPRREIDVGKPALGSGASTALAAALVLALILLALRFGGGGMLLRADPRAGEALESAPPAWRDDRAGDAGDPRRMLARLEAAADRAAALTELLRRCLIRGAEETSTRFARADTEREAYARLPEAWAGRAPLARVLREAELAHYGGRPVGDEAHAAAFAAARAIFGFGAEARG